MSDPLDPCDPPSATSLILISAKCPSTLRKHAGIQPGFSRFDAGSRITISRRRAHREPVGPSTLHCKRAVSARPADASAAGAPC